MALDLDSSTLLINQVLGAKNLFTICNNYTKSKKGNVPAECQALLISLYYQPHSTDEEIKGQED